MKAPPRISKIGRSCCCQSPSPSASGGSCWRFYGTILWRSIIALPFGPLYRRLLARLKGRRTLAALLTLLIALVIVILPAAAREASWVYERIQAGEWKPALYFKGVFTALPDWMMALPDRSGLANFEILQRRLDAALAQGSQFIATHALSLGQDRFEFVTSFFITLYLAFFLIRDGDDVVLAVRRAILPEPQHKQELIDKSTTVIRATVKGRLVVASIEGVLGGMARWCLGVGEVLLLGFLTAFLSLLPAFGAALVWLPVAMYFFMTGAFWKGIVMIAYGALVIGLVDNVLRPVLVGRDTRVPDYVVMITTLGGIAVFGQRLRSRSRNCSDVYRGLAHLCGDAAWRNALGHRRQ